MTKKRILIVDDEQSICDVVSFNLVLAGFETAIANSAREALNLGIDRFDLLLLDVMMKEISGFELARMVKDSPSTRHVPIIFMTAKDDEQDILKGCELGADDYIVKPFSIAILYSKLLALLERSTQEVIKHKILESGQIQLDPVRFEVKVAGEVVDLPPKEYQILKYMMEHPGTAITRLEFDLLKTFLMNKGRVLSREQIIQSAWPKKVYVSQRTVDVSITRLRRKLGSYSNCIVTRTGFGYCFE